MSLTQPTSSKEKRRKGRRRFRRLRDLLRNEKRRRRALLATGIAVAGVVSAMAFLTSRQQELPFDVGTTVRLQDIRFKPFADAMWFVSVPGYFPENVILVGASGLAVSRWLNVRDGLYLIGLTSVNGLANYVLKTVTGRARPTEPLVEVLLPHAGKSFPSGHVMFYTVFFGFLFFLAWTRLPRSPLRKGILVVTGALVALVAPSRVYIGAHWLSDVVAGHLVSLIVLLAGIEIYVKYIVQRPAALPEEESESD